MSTHRFILEPYKGIATRHTCPECHKKRSFARYIDTEGKIEFPPYVGRCNHEQSCGYHFTPKDFFEKNPEKNETFTKDESISYKKREMPKPLPTSYIDENIMRSSQKCYEANNLFLFLSSQFGEAATLSLMEKYHVGTSKHWTGATVFWQVDNQGKVRTGKVMLYYPETGKRVKEPYNHISWVHSLIPHKDFNLCQCFFGEHLINKDKTKPIALVESEKTALIASYYLPQFLWIASGGKNGCFKTKSLSVLKNRDVILFPDLGATTVWQDKLPMMHRQVSRVVFSVTFQHRFQNDALRTSRNDFRCRYQFHAVSLQLSLVPGTVVAVSGKTIQLPDNDDIKDAAFAVFNHLLELRAVVRFCGDGTVNVMLYHREAILFRIGGAFPDLTFNGFLALAVS